VYILAIFYVIDPKLSITCFTDPGKY